MKPEEDPGFNTPGDPDRPHLDPSLIGLPATSANTEALRTAHAIEAFKDCMLNDEALRLRIFIHAAKSQVSEQKLAVARSKPKSHPLVDALRVVADAARARGGKLWPSVRDAIMETTTPEAPALVGGLEVTRITGKGFADSHDKRDLKGIRITFELPDGTQQTIAASTTYDYIMRK